MARLIPNVTRTGSVPSGKHRKYGMNVQVSIADTLATTASPRQRSGVHDDGRGHRFTLSA